MVVAIVERAPARLVFTRFIPPVSVDDAPGRWQAYYRKWPMVTREHLDPNLLDLVPALRRYAPPAQVFDKSVYSAFAAPGLLPELAAPLDAPPPAPPLHRHHRRHPVLGPAVTRM